MRNWILIQMAGIMVLLTTPFVLAAEDTPLPPPPPPPTAPTIPEAPDTPSAPAEATTAEGTTQPERRPSENGTPGRIKGGRVNIRSGPSTRFEIVVTLNPESAVTVYAKKGDWYQIAYPQQQYCYVHQRHIEGSIVDIPPDGLLRSIIGQKAIVRVRPWNKSTPVGSLKQGDLVTIAGIRGQWAKIKPPAAARAWVFGKYVRTTQEVTGNPGELTAQTPPPNTGHTPVRSEPKKKSDLAKLAAAKKRAAYEAMSKRTENTRKAHLAALRQVVDDINSKLKAIDDEGKIEQPTTQPTPPLKTTVQPEPYKPGERDMGGFTGWIEYIGRVGKRPAAFRLVKGGEIVFMLRSSQYNLADYVNKRVAVDGEVEPAPGFQANVMIVNTMRVLGEPPIPVRQQKVKIRRPYVPATSTSPNPPKTTPPPVLEKPARSRAATTTNDGELPIVIREGEAAPAEDDKAHEKVFEPGE